MKTVLSDFEIRYNTLLSREKKAEIFFDNLSVEQIKKDNWIPEFMKITESLSLLMSEHKTITGEEMATEVILNGF